MSDHVVYGPLLVMAVCVSESIGLLARLYRAAFLDRFFWGNWNHGFVEWQQFI